MICLNSEGLFFLDQLKKLRAQTEINLDNDQEICSDESMDTIDKIRKIRSERVEQLKETIAEYNPEAMFADGHDHAIMGYSSDGRVVYSADQIIGGLMNEGMTQEEAVEYFGFNIECAYVGEYTPIYMYEE